MPPPNRLASVIAVAAVAGHLVRSSEPAVTPPVPVAIPIPDPGGWIDGRGDGGHRVPRILFQVVEHSDRLPDRARIAAPEGESQAGDRCFAHLR